MRSNYSLQKPLKTWPVCCSEVNSVKGNLPLGGTWTNGRRNSLYKSSNKEVMMEGRGTCNQSRPSRTEYLNYSTLFHWLWAEQWKRGWSHSQIRPQTKQKHVGVESRYLLIEITCIKVQGVVIKVRVKSKDEWSDGGALWNSSTANYMHSSAWHIGLFMTGFFFIRLASQDVYASGESTVDIWSF